MVDDVVLFVLLMDFQSDLSSLLNEVSMLILSLLELSQQIIDLSQFLLGISAPQTHIGHVQLQLACESVVDIFQFVMELGPLLFEVVKLTSKLLNLFIEVSSLDLGIVLIHPLELTVFQNVLTLNTLEVGNHLFVLRVGFVGRLLLLIKRLSQLIVEELQLVLQHLYPFLLLGVSLLEKGALVLELVFETVLAHVLFVELHQGLLQRLLLALDGVSLIFLFLEHCLDLFSFLSHNLTLLVVFLQVLHPLLRDRLHLLMQRIQLSVPLENLVEKGLVGVGVVLSAMLDGLLQLHGFNTAHILINL
jgi:hypothetical protein